MRCLAALGMAVISVLSVSMAVRAQTNLAQALPELTGRYPVGRRSFYWLDAVRSGRPVPVAVWYPAESRPGTAAEYLPNLKLLLANPTTAQAMASTFGSSAPSAQTGMIRPYSHENAPVARRGGPFPILLFSPGFGNSPFCYAIQLEDLASHGYVVVAVAHVRDSIGVVSPDGMVIPLDQPPAITGNEQFFKARAELWAEDLVFALNQMRTLSQERNSSFFRALDLNSIGAFGHSHGGRSAATACMLEPQIKACLNEDGRLDEGELQRPYWPLGNRAFHGTFAMLDWFDSGLDQQDFAAMHTTPGDYAKARLKPSGAALEAYQAVEGGSYHFTLLQPGMKHTAFSDLPWLTASSDPTRAQYGRYRSAIRVTVREFFDHMLKKKAVPMMACDSVQGEVLLQCSSHQK